MTQSQLRQPPVGIDLGTTLSVLAYIDSAGELATLRNAEGELLTPSAVFFGDSVMVGRDAVRRATSAPKAYADCFKREMGKPFIRRPIHDRQTPPEVLSAFVLEKLKRDAERVLGPITDAVITVPAFYDEPRRRATQEAGRLAGLNVIDIVNEPTAAAVAFGYQQRGANGFTSDSGKRSRILVYDLGGGTFDASVLEFADRKFLTLATDGDIRLGGRDFDEKLVHFLAARFQEAHGVDPGADAADMQQLWLAAESAKHALSKQDKTTVSFTHAGLRMNVDVSRAEFEDLIAPYVERTIDTCEDVLREAGVKWTDLDYVLLVGGSSRIPMVGKRLQAASGQSPRMADRPDELVAHGAALYAASHTPSLATPLEIVNVNSHSLGIAGVDVKTNERINKILIPRNTTLPASAHRRFVTHKDGQNEVVVQVLEGESTNPKFCTVVGRCSVQLEPNTPAGATIEVTCQYEANGVLSISARDARTRHSATVEISRDSAGVMESLDVWRARLTTGPGGESAATTGAVSRDTMPSDEPLVDLSDRAAMLRRLDFLWTQIGAVGLSSAAPAGALSCQRALAALGQERSAVQKLSQRVERALAKAADHFERTRLLGVDSHLKLRARQLESLLAQTQLAFGRACVDEGFCPPGAEAWREEARRLVPILMPE